MEIGVYLRREQTYDKMLKLALHADNLGYFGAFLNDHVHGFANGGNEPYLEAWTAMTGIGVQTKNLRVGQIVLFNSLRNPAFLAKSVAALDNMTNGRYELLIGAGWNEPEYKGYDLMEGGRGMPGAGERVSRFEESLKILNLMLHQEVTDYDGKYWKLDGAINNPQPVQNPMRISVGCKGPRMMKITAKYATGLNLSTRMLDLLEEQINTFKNIVSETTEKSIDDYYLSGFSSFTVIDDESKLKESTENMIERSNSTLSVEEYLNTSLMIGSTDQMIEKLKVLKSMGMKMIVSVIDVDGMDSKESITYFKNEILAKL